MANISLKIILEMLFIILSGADANFLENKLRWRTYTIVKAISTIW